MHGLKGRTTLKRNIKAARPSHFKKRTILYYTADTIPDGHSIQSMK